MVPSTYEDGTLYNVLPSGNKAPDETGNHNGYDQTRADFTFDRGNNLAATRVNADGLIEKGRENAIPYSNTFNIGWNAVNASVTSGQSGYDGFNNAWLLTKSAAHGNLNINMASSSSDIHTFSLYAKANASEWMRMTIGSPRVNVFFNVANGTLGEVSPNAIDAKIEEVDETGWYRCSFSTTYAAWVEILPAETMNDTGGTSGSIYIQNAQVEKSLVATDYIETGATTAKAGILEDMPRIDYTSGTGALLLEGLRSNGIPHSEYFSGWTAINNVSLTENSTTSPEGRINASLMSVSGAGSFARSIRAGSQSTTTDKKTMSVFAKANTTDTIQLYHSGEVQGYVNFDLSSGEVGTSGTNGTGDIIPMGNGWYRCIATFDSVGNFGSSVYVGFATSSSAPYGGGSISDTSLSVYIWGAQYEIGAYVSSYIPSYGSAVSRSADSLFVESLADELTTGYTAATLMIEFKYKQDSVGDAFVWGQDNTTYPAGRGYLYNKQSGFADSFGGGGFNDMSEDTTLKMIYRLNTLSNADVFLNGTKGTTVSGTAWSAINQIRFRGAYYTFEISQIAMFSEALTDAECITLTTL